MNSKISVLLLTFVTIVAGGHVSGGHSNTWRKDDGHGNFNFGYDITDGHGAKNFRTEQGDAHGHRTGSYGLHDVDGRVRVVHYVADKDGFRAKIQSNEPGVGDKDAAYAVYNGPDKQGYGNNIQHVSGGYGDGGSSYGHGGGYGGDSYGHGHGEY